MSAEELHALERAFLALPSLVVGGGERPERVMLEASFGPNFTPARANGYTHGLRVLFPDKEALALYATHPAHVAFVHMLPLDTDSSADPPVLAVDWLRSA